MPQNIPGSLDRNEALEVKPVCVKLGYFLKEKVMGGI